MLVSSMLTVGVLAGVLTATFGVLAIYRSVRSEAQTRVDFDLNVVSNLYESMLRAPTFQLVDGAETIDPTADNVSEKVASLRAALGFTILNLVRVDGAPVAGNYADMDARVAFSKDPTIRQALRGNCASGTTLLDGKELLSEGGRRLADALAIRSPESGRAVTDSALFWWYGCPVKDARGRVVAVLYGGKTLNHDAYLVDNLRDLIFGTRRYGNRPLGTVTVFLRDIRVTTNVLEPNGERAVGTRVSPEVADRVLAEGKLWQSRAWVVDAWYLSAYRPLRDPAGRIIGMLYVGLLESPYSDLRARLLEQFLLPLALVELLVLFAALLFVRRLTRPLRALASATLEIARGELDRHIPATKSYTELVELTHSFDSMRNAIARRDRELRDKNERLETTNRNYMQMLGFIAHELKSPLAAMQSLISVVVDDMLGGVPERMSQPLIRIKRNAEELQDMIKNYLDLSRAERGEMEVHRREIDICAEVAGPSVDQTRALFDSRGMTIEADCPAALQVEADPELLRIALTNYLTNAAKYGREGGLARLGVTRVGAELRVEVWNEGAGFTAEEGEKLFGKFERLQNENTRGKRGSGLGLYLCKEAIELHGGRVWAESEPGRWARFSLSIPASGDG